MKQKIIKELEQEILVLLEKKQEEMCDFLNKYMTLEERNRIGDDIVRIMPNKGDVSMIKMKLMDRSIKEDQHGSEYN